MTDPDAYEARYMGDGAIVLHRERARGRPWWHALFAASAGVLVAAPLVAGAPIWAALPGVAVLAASWAMMTVLRVAVTTRAVHVQLGPFGPTIPIAGVESVETTSVNLLWHGWGVHLALDGTWCFTLPTATKKAVRIVWSDAKGRRRKTLVSSDTPDVLKQAIERARDRDLAAARAGGGVADAPSIEEELVHEESVSRPRGAPRG